MEQSRRGAAHNFVTGGKHVMSEDMFKAVELNRRTVKAMEREKDKKRPVEYHATHEAVLPIVDRLKNELENNVRRLKSKELDVLLWWKSVPVSAIGNVANTQILCQKIAEGGVEEASIPALWMEIDEAGLIMLRDAPTT